MAKAKVKGTVYKSNVEQFIKGRQDPPNESEKDVIKQAYKFGHNGRYKLGPKEIGSKVLVACGYRKRDENWMKNTVRKMQRANLLPNDREYFKLGDGSVRCTFTYKNKTQEFSVLTFQKKEP